jgi:hypothetical protein
MGLAAEACQPVLLLPLALRGARPPGRSSSARRETLECFGRAKNILRRAWYRAPIGTGRHAGLLCERFFPYVFFHTLTATPEGLRWDLVRWRLLFLPLPRRLMPVAVCFESGDGDNFVFDIDAAFRIVGPVVHYRGWLLPKAEEG